MTASSTDSAPEDSAAAADWYPDPAGVGGSAQRWWDGEVWTDRTRTGTDQVAEPEWTRNHLAFVRHRWFHVALVALVISVSGAVLYAAVDHVATLVIFVSIASALVALAFGLHLDSRLRMHQVVRPNDLLFAFVVGGLVGQAIAQTERLLPKGDPWSILAVGPIEEIAKLAVPVAMFLWGARRYANPRTGLALVLASAAAFGVVETATYAERAATEPVGDAVLFSVAAFKPFLDPVIHMTITGLFAAVAWRAWHLRGGFTLSGAVVGTLALTMAMHDVLDLANSVDKGLGSLVLMPVLLVAYYLGFKHMARREVPPDAVGDVPPGWRPTNLPTERAAAPQGRTSPRPHDAEGRRAA